MPDFNKQQALLFMPDISGFTDFVHEMEIEHSTHIIQELLEIIIDGNKLNLEVMEIEGDAVFFFRFGKMPDINEIIQQSKIMFDKFHQHLMKYERQRICQCGACKTAINLTLKFIIHSGLVSSYYVKRRHKLIGPDVILLHRLLKNSVSENSYLLFTESFLDADKSDANQQVSFISKSEKFDHQIIHYKYLPIKQWNEELEDHADDMPNKEEDLISMFSINKSIDSSAEDLFNYVADLSKRAGWMEGTRRIEIAEELRMNRVGQVHKCILTNNSSSEFETKDFRYDEHELTFTELDARKGNYGYRFTIRKLSSGASNIQIEYLLKNNSIQKTFFKLFSIIGINKSLKRSLENLEKIFQKMPVNNLPKNDS